MKNFKSNKNILIIDIKDKKCVRLVRQDFDNKTEYRYVRI